METMKRAAAIVLLAFACREEAKPPSPPAQPSSQPSSTPASPPAHHRTAATPVELTELFRMPETAAIAIQLGDRKIVREELQRRLRRMQLQMEGVGLPENVDRREILGTLINQL